MKKSKYWILLICLLLNLSCHKENEADDTNATVSITGITSDKTIITVTDTVKLECTATSSGQLYYHWSLMAENTVYDSGIIDKANLTDTFDYGKWIKWRPPVSGTWDIEVLAYLSSGDHTSAGNGTWYIFYEYGSGGTLLRKHCFNYAEQGKLWDLITITKSVGK